jgi:nucleoside-diphosphate-sugar epimerase
LLNLNTTSYINDIRDYSALKRVFIDFKPEIVFHLAAQSSVLVSYEQPLETFSTNIIGTANVLEASRTIDSVKSVIIVTTDKCYKNNEWIYGYREIDELYYLELLLIFSSGINVTKRPPHSEIYDNWVSISSRKFHGSIITKSGLLSQIRSSDTIGM